MRRYRRKFSTGTDVQLRNEWLLDKKIADKASLFCLRLIEGLDMYDFFVHKYESEKVRIINKLVGLPSISESEDEEMDIIPPSVVKESVQELKIQVAQKRLKLERKKPLKTYPILAKNLATLQDMMNLNPKEVEILECAILMESVYLLKNMIDLIESDYFDHEILPIKKLLAIMVDVKEHQVINAFRSGSHLYDSKLMNIVPGRHGDGEEIEFMTNDFAQEVCHYQIEELLGRYITPTQPAQLKLQDYTHIQKELDVLIPYLKQTILSRQKGVNILIHGKPGTGKTELVKTLAESLKIKLFHINTELPQIRNEKMSSRIGQYRFAQSFLTSKKTLLLYDEAEDVFVINFWTGILGDKAHLNQDLETNAIPTLWLTNNVQMMDSATLRRFNIVIEMPILPQEKTMALIRKQAKNLLSEKSIKAIASHGKVAPSLITNTAEVIRTAKVKNSDQAFVQNLNSILKAQGYPAINFADSMPAEYNPNFVNCQINLQQLTQDLEANPNARICLYGVPGTGKSAFAKYVAEILGKPFILKKGSDLLSMWIGESEKNIASAFEEAKRQDGVLVFDEVDSFLQSREQAQRTWEVTQVNEMLQQMENFDGIFIATTNLVDNLDKASIRRFDIKAEFKQLNPKQIWEIFKVYGQSANLKITAASQKKVARLLHQMTPGNFATVLRQHRFRPIQDIDDFIKRLQEEVKMQQDAKAKIGF